MTIFGLFATLVMLSVNTNVYTFVYTGSMVNSCSVEDCNVGGKLRRGCCEKHYRRLMRYGSTNKPPPRKPRATPLHYEPKLANCSLDGCDRVSKLRRGYCDTHYRRLMRDGDPGDAVIAVTGLGARDPRPLLDRIDRNGSGGCWIWTGSIDRDGYGYLHDGRRHNAHRWTYEKFVGPIPDGLEIDHLCRVRPCVNPDHLEPVTRLENNLRRWYGVDRVS